MSKIVHKTKFGLKFLRVFNPKMPISYHKESAKNLMGINKGRMTFWLVDETTQLHRDRAMLLEQSGHHVIFFQSLQECLNQIQSSRPHIFIIEDHGPVSHVMKALKLLVIMPEINGCKMILSISQFNPDAIELGIYSNFRDLIPLELNPNEWLERFLFSTSSKPIAPKIPSHQVTVNQLMSLHLPIRIVALSADEIIFESRGKHSMGSKLSISGPVLKKIGIEHTFVEVKETARKRLVYRYSKAYRAELSIPPHKKAEFLEVLEELQKTSKGLRLRAFIAVQDITLRNQLLARLEQHNIECNMALQRSQLAAEVNYFTPDMIFYDDGVLESLTDKELNAICEHKTLQSKSIIFGSTKSVDRMKFHQGKKPVYHENFGIGENFNPVKRYGLSVAQSGFRLTEDGVYLSSQQDESFAQLTFPARLVKLHPRCGEISSQLKIDNYATCIIDSPLLRKITNKNPVIKLVASEEVSFQFNTPPYSERSTFLFGDLNLKESQAIGQYLIQSALDHFKQMFGFELRLPGKEQPLQKAAEVVEKSAPVVNNDVKISSIIGVRNLEKSTAEILALNNEYTIPNDSPRPTYNAPKKPKPPGIPAIYAAMIFIATIAFLGGGMWWMASYGSQYYSKSGGEYSDQLKKFQKNAKKLERSPNEVD